MKGLQFIEPQTILKISNSSLFRNSNNVITKNRKASLDTNGKFEFQPEGNYTRSISIVPVLLSLFMNEGSLVNLKLQ